MDIDKLKLTLREEFKDNLVIVNGKEYVDIDILKKSVVETCFLDAMLGCIVEKLGNLEITDKELDEFISKKFNSTETVYEDGKHIIRRVSK